MPSKDFIPAADAAFDAWSVNLLSRIHSGKTRWGITDAAYNALHTDQVNWHGEAASRGGR